MNKTTNNNSLKDYKLEYEDTNQPKKRILKSKVTADKIAPKKHPKRQGVIKTYIKAMIEVILA